MGYTNKDLDLDLDNYEFEDLLNLFNINPPFGVNELKKAYKVVLSTHPDKSNLPKEYFLFFSKSFKLLKQVYDYSHKKESCLFNSNIDKDDAMKYKGEYNDVLDIENIKEMTNEEKREFNKIFNEQFEKIKILDESTNSGYDEWLRSNEDTRNDNITLKNEDDLHDYINKKKNIQRTHFLTNYSGVQDLHADSFNGNLMGSGLLNEKPKEYSCGLFSKLKYDDLKKAHTETLIPVTEQDINTRRGAKFNSYETMEIFRKQDANITGKEYEEAIIKQREKEQETEVENVKNAFKMMKQMNKIEKSHNLWNAYFKRLNN